MPKQLKVIDDFSGGLNTFSGAREIADNEFVKLEGLSVGANGALRSGAVGTLVTSSAVGNGLDPYPTLFATNEVSGHNLFSFSSDRHYNGKQDDGSFVGGEHWVALADKTGTNKVNIFGRYNGGYETISAITAASPAVITCSDHGNNITTSSYVRFSGIVGNMGTDLLNNTIHKVTAVADSTHFSVAVDTSGKTYSSGGYAKGGQPGWILAGDEPQPSDDTHSMIDFAFADGALRTSSGNFSYSGHSNKWWGYIARTLFEDTSQTDSVPAEYYPLNAECAKPNPSTFKLAETIGLVASATHSYNPDLVGNGGASATDTQFQDEPTMDADTLSNAPTIESITIDVDVVDEMSGSGAYSGIQIQIGRSTDTGSSFDSTNYHTWTISGRGTSSRQLSWTGSWAIANGGANGLLSKLTIVDADVDDAITVSITNITVNETSGSWSNHAGLQGNNIHVGFAEDTLAGSTGWGGNWEVGVTLLYDDPRKQESLITLCTNETGGGAEHIVLTEGKAPAIPIFIKYDNDSGTSSLNWNKRVTGCKVYMRELQSPKSSDRSEWFPQAECDFIAGTVKAFESGKTAPAEWNLAQTQHIFYLAKENFIRPHKRSTFEIESGIPEDEKSTMPRYKTSVVANRRLYVGNLMVSYDDGSEEVMGDTMIKSVVDNYDVLPVSNRIDAAIKDGDSIVKLMEYGDRILQFKEKTLYVINIAQGREFLEGSYKGKGIPVKSAAVQTDYGIAWVNQHGCYLYNGRTIVDLMVDRNGRKKIDPEVWAGSIGKDVDSPVNVGYSATGKVLVVDLDASEENYFLAYVYDFKTGAWSFHPDSITHKSTTTQRSNMVERWDGELMYSTFGTFFLWKDEVNKDDKAQMITKDFVIGGPNKKVKLYNVYLTYKTTAAIATVTTGKFQYALDGSGNFNNFNAVYVDGAILSPVTLASTFTNLQASTTNILIDGGVADGATNSTVTLDANGTNELVPGDFIKAAGTEYMKVLEMPTSTVLKVKRGHPIGGVIGALSNDAQVSVLRWKQARFAITAPPKCNSVQIRFAPATATAVMIQNITFEYRPLFKETT